MGLFSFLKQDRKTEVTEEKPAAVKPLNAPVENTVKYLTEADVEMIDDDEKLMEIIKGKYDWKLTKCAVSRLKDQKPLMDYMKQLTSYSDGQKRGAIIAGISDQEMLAEIASKDKDYHLRQSAMKRLKDKNIIRKALIERFYSITEVGDMLKKLNRDDQLYVIENSTVSSTVETALRIVGDQMRMAEYMIRNNTDKLMNLVSDKEAFEKIAAEATDNKLKAEAVRRMGGYICSSCGKLNPPGEDLTCNCRFCGAENHDYVHVNNIQEYRDYEVGTTYDECTRCHKQINFRSVNTM